MVTITINAVFWLKVISVIGLSLLSAKVAYSFGRSNAEKDFEEALYHMFGQNEEGITTIDLSEIANSQQRIKELEEENSKLKEKLNNK